MKRVILIAAVAACGAAHAAPGNLADSGHFSTGHSTVGHLAAPVRGNPALLTRSLRPEQRVRTNIFDLPSVSVEIGKADDFIDRFEAIEDRIDQGFNSIAEAEAFIENEARPVFADIAREGFATIDAQMPLPALPVSFRALDGVFSVHADAYLSARASVINADDFRVVEDNGDFDIETDSAALARVGIFQRIAVGYGRELMPLQVGHLRGQLHVGGRFSLIRGQLSQVVAGIASADDGDDAFDRIEDNFDRNERSSVGVGVDVGGAFVMRDFHLGLTLRNLIPPGFNFGRLGDCGNLDGTDLQDCQLEARLGDAGLLDLNRKFRQSPQGMVEALYHFPDVGIALFGSLELNHVPNLAGDRYQFLQAGAAFDGPWWAPSLRAGLRQNLVGSSITSLNAGLTLFRVFNLDVLYGLSSARHDGSSYPRALGVRLGFSMPL